MIKCPGKAFRLQGIFRELIRMTAEHSIQAAGELLPKYKV